MLRFNSGFIYSSTTANQRGESPENMLINTTICYTEQITFFWWMHISHIWYKHNTTRKIRRWILHHGVSQDIENNRRILLDSLVSIGIVGTYCYFSRLEMVFDCCFSNKATNLHVTNDESSHIVFHQSFTLHHSMSYVYSFICDTHSKLSMNFIIVTTV
jgi:hypothetical protein